MRKPRGVLVRLPRQTFWRVTLPEVMPALLTGFALAFARGFGEYGSVVFIAGNQPIRKPKSCR